jgi:hypothetical protein
MHSTAAVCKTPYPLDTHLHGLLSTIQVFSMSLQPFWATQCQSLAPRRESRAGTPTKKHTIDAPNLLATARSSTILRSPELLRNCKWESHTRAYHSSLPMRGRGALRRNGWANVPGSEAEFAGWCAGEAGMPQNRMWKRKGQKKACVFCKGDTSWTFTRCDWCGVNSGGS